MVVVWVEVCLCLYTFWPFGLDLLPMLLQVDWKHYPILANKSYLFMTLPHLYTSHKLTLSLIEMNLMLSRCFYQNPQSLSIDSVSSKNYLNKLFLKALVHLSKLIIETHKERFMSIKEVILWINNFVPQWRINKFGLKSNESQILFFCSLYLWNLQRRNINFN